MGTYTVEGMIAEYAEFGEGTLPMVVVPGVGDGLRTVGGSDRLLGMYYRKYAKDFRVFLVSRPHGLPQGATTRDMARYLNAFFATAGLDSAYVCGISQGGMIAQWLAIDYPDRVRKLCLMVSTPHVTNAMQQVIGTWRDLAREANHADLVVSICENTFSAHRLRWYRMAYPLLRRIGKPKDWKRFIIQAEACLTHDASHHLSAINVPTLVVGGDADLVIGSGMSEELAHGIADAELKIYSGWGHGAYEEAPGVLQLIADFFNEQGYKPKMVEAVKK